MGPYRNENPVISGLPRRQSGITVIGLVFMVAIFGFLGLAGLKIVPLYLEKMRIESVLGAIERDVPGQSASISTIRNELSSRLYVESIQLPRQDVSIRQVRNGFQVQVQHEMRAEFFGDLWFLVVVNEQVDIPR